MARRAIGLLVLATLTIPMLGCLAAVFAGAAAGTGVAYWQGRLEVHVDGGPLDYAVPAEQAVEDIGGSVESVESHDRLVVVTGRTADDKRIEIRVERRTQRTSLLAIRIGVFGDEELSIALYDKIKQSVEPTKG
jgi:hypothetical protein